MLKTAVHVLLVTGDRQLETNIQDFFSLDILSWQVWVAKSVADASALMMVKTIDLVITDYMLKDGRGAEIIEQANSRTLPTILLVDSASSNDGHGDCVSVVRTWTGLAGLVDQARSLFCRSLRVH